MSSALLHFETERAAALAGQHLGGPVPDRAKLLLQRLLDTSLADRHSFTDDELLRLGIACARVVGV